MDGRGYTSYRGRGSGGRPVLTALLIAVILASAAFVLVREQMSYDAQGRLRFRLPWGREQTTEVPPVDPDPEVEIQPPPAPSEPVAAVRRGVVLPAQPLTQADLEALLPTAEAEVLAVTLKDETGRIYFDAAGAVSGARRIKEDTGQALRQLTAGEGTAMGRISCFLDSRAAKADVEGLGLKNTGGYIFYDGDSRQWLDPGKEGAREYLLNLIVQAADLGFGEILLTHVSYPTKGKLHKIDFSNAQGETGRQENIETFLRSVRSALPEGVTLSLELDAETVRKGGNEDAGQSLSRLAALVDCIYAPAAEEEVPELAAAVSAAGGVFIPQVSQRPSEELRQWLLKEQ